MLRFLEGGKKGEKNYLLSSKFQCCWTKKKEQSGEKSWFLLLTKIDHIIAICVSAFVYPLWKCLSLYVSVYEYVCVWTCVPISVWPMCDSNPVDVFLNKTNVSKSHGVKMGQLCSMFLSYWASYCFPYH